MNRVHASGQTRNHQSDGYLDNQAFHSDLMENLKVSFMAGYSLVKQYPA